MMKMADSSTNNTLFQENPVVSSSGQTNRMIEVLIFPTKEDSPRLNKTTAMRFVSDGTRNTLGITVHIEKSILGIPPSTSVMLYNISRDTFSAIRKPDMKMVINVYPGLFETSSSDQYSEEQVIENDQYQGWIQVYSGAVTGVKSEKEGADIITTVFSLTKAEQYLYSVSTASYSAGTKMSDIAKDLGNNMKAQAVLVDTRIGVIEIGWGGFTFQGCTADILNKLGFQYGFTWSFYDNVLHVRHDDSVTGRITVISPESGLMSATPILAGPFQIMSGVNVKSFYWPDTVEGNLVEVKSAINTYLNGQYRIHLMHIDLSTVSNQWDMNLDCFVNPVSGQIWDLKTYGIRGV